MLYKKIMPWHMHLNLGNFILDVMNYIIEFQENIYFSNSFMELVAKNAASLVTRAEWASMNC